MPTSQAHPLQTARDLFRDLRRRDRAVAARRRDHDARRGRDLRACCGARSSSRSLRRSARRSPSSPRASCCATGSRRSSATSSKAINAGVEKEGAFYLFALRLVPAFPFFVINLAMGLTPMRTRTFYWVSQLGMLAGTIVYVYAGTQLGAVRLVAGQLSPAIIGSFVLLGIFPLIAKKIARRAQGAQGLRDGGRGPRASIATSS